MSNIVKELGTSNTASSQTVSKQTVSKQTVLVPQTPSPRSTAPRLNKKSPTTVSDFSPDDLVIVQKRQDWRLRVAHICIEYFEHGDATRVARGTGKSPEDVARLAVRFGRISDYVKRVLPSLLMTGVSVHELEAVRYQVNYFLEEIVRHLRVSIQGRLKTKTPLEASTQAQIEEEVSEALQEQGDSLCLFIEDLVKLAQFELEIGNQRERIRLLLGGDRRLSGLGNNETIMSAPPDQLHKAVRDFMSTSAYLRENLPPILGKKSPYPTLEEELQVGCEQLALLVRDRIEPFESLYLRGESQDGTLHEFEQQLRQCLNLATEIVDERLTPLLGQARVSRGRSAPAVQVNAAELNLLYTAVRQMGEKIERLPPELHLPDPKTLQASAGGMPEGLTEIQRCLETLRMESAALLRTPLVKRGVSEIVLEAELEELLHKTFEQAVPLRTSLNTALLEVQALREFRVKPLRELFCTVLGEFRTFLQTSFAHIAAQDPRSTESSYHFFLREFSNEAHQAILLLHEIRGLEYFINKLQKVNVAGLPLTPENLARILRVLFIDKDEEKKQIPTGEGWKLMSSFLLRLRDELVPRLQKVCALDGIRYEDKNFLSEWAMDLARNCTLCLAEHEIGYSLLQEMGRLRGDPESAVAHRSHIHIVTAKTCNAMQKSLTEICMTLTASIPYVGIMRGGIERRASIFFHRQQKLLENSADMEEASGDVITPEIDVPIAV